MKMSNVGVKSTEAQKGKKDRMCWILEAWAVSSCYSQLTNENSQRQINTYLTGRTFDRKHVNKTYTMMH